MECCSCQVSRIIRYYKGQSTRTDTGTMIPSLVQLSKFNTGVRILVYTRSSLFCFMYEQHDLATSCRRSRPNTRTRVSSDSLE
jgi:hypothetical protein